jgi:hypothetical protein
MDDYQNLYMTLISIVTTLFSISGVSLLYFWKENEKSGADAISALNSIGKGNLIEAADSNKERLKGLFPIKSLKELNENGPFFEKFFDERLSKRESPEEDASTIEANTRLMDANASLIDAHIKFDIYNQSLIRDISTNKIILFINSFLSLLVLIFGIIIPVYMLTPNPNTLSIPNSQIAVLCSGGTLIILAILGGFAIWRRFLMNRITPAIGR